VPEDEVRARLKTLLWECPARDLMRADLARALNRTISDHAEAINRSGFGDPLGLIQHFLSYYSTLAIGRLFDVQRGFELQSLPRLLDLIDEHAEQIIPQDPVRVRQYLAAHGRQVPTADSELTRALLACVRFRVPRANHPHQEIAKTFAAVKFRRDKVVAHRETLATDVLPQTTWAEEDKLLDLAREVLGAIGYLFGDLFEHEGEWLLAPDVARSARRLETLRERAGVIEATGERGEP
jgi:hypothetical protein